MRRLTELLAGETASTAGTKTIDITLSQLISRIVVQFKGTNSTGVPTAHPATMVSKIELVDGSDVLFSLSGKEIQALNFYETGKLAPAVLMYVDNVMAIVTFHLNFGRFLWDKTLAIDPARFNNLQLKITHNMAAGGGAPDAGNLSVFAFVMDKTDASPTGFLMSKEIQSYTLTSSAHEYITLPIDYPYRKLLVASLYTGKQPFEQYNKIKLSVDNDAQVLINNMSTSDLIKLMSSDQRFTEFLVGTGTGSAETTYLTSSMWTYISCLGLNTALASIVPAQSYGGTVSINADSAETYQLLISGQAPHGAIDILAVDGMLTDDFLKVAGMGSLKLDITAGSSVGSGSTCQIVAQQLRTYK